MKKKYKLNTQKVAKALGAEYRGKVSASSGYFGAMQLAADVQARFHTPSGGGRSTDPSWTEKRLISLAPKTLERLERIAVRTSEQSGMRTAPLQIAAILLERAVTAVEISRNQVVAVRDSFPSLTRRSQYERTEAIAAEIRQRRSIFAPSF